MLKAARKAFRKAAEEVIRTTPGARETAGHAAVGSGKRDAPVFELRLPAQRAVSEYANSVWTGVSELYETCRGHGAKLANGIELGTRDRGQDMWPKMKEDPGTVRADLVHALGFMYCTTDKPIENFGALTLREKLHGMFPRQYPSRWDDRGEAVFNDNRPYADSPLWLLNSLMMYIRETGDAGILNEEVTTVWLTDPEQPETSGIIGNKRRQRVIDAVFEVFESYQRHVKDTPYHLAQILYGDWCDPVDMFGTSVVGDTRTRGRGKGVQIRLSAHLFHTMVEAVDTLGASAARSALTGLDIDRRLTEIGKFASELREQMVKVAWEDNGGAFPAGFISAIHEMRKDGSTPDYGKGEIGYTLGSMRGLDFDGVKRRDLAVQAWGLQALATDRPYLKPIAGSDEMVRKLLSAVDKLHYDKKLGLVMYTVPMANNREVEALVGRMGIVPSGCAENGEYHHCQVFMHCFRMNVAGEADKVWQQMSPILSVTRDETIGGPFESPSNSYASDKADPHFGKGMYFGLSGQVDWLVEVFQKVAGVELALHDDARPDVSVRPRLPAALAEQLVFRRVIHQVQDGGGYRQIPLTVEIGRIGKGRNIKEPMIKVNGKVVSAAEVKKLEGLDSVKIEITYVHG